MSLIPKGASSYQALADRWLKAHHLGHLQSIASWDRAACMPSKGNEARAAAMAEMSVLLHELLTPQDMAEQLTAASGEALDESQQANLREMRRHWLSLTALEAKAVRELQLAGARCEHAWRSQRPANDWQGFLPNFREVLRLSREKAHALSQKLGIAPYDALMDQFEPGLTSAALDVVFNDLRSWLPQLIQEAAAKQKSDTVLKPTGPFPVEKQKQLCEAVMRLLGFDFEAGRLDVSAHPFCGGVPEDVRITTRFNEADFMGSLFGTIHETGHARYEQGRPKAWLGQPASRARSMAIHESQSLFFEMQLGCHPGFLRRLAGMIAEHLGQQAAFEPDNLAMLLTRVKPGKIRVDADEVSYPAHILLRYDIEKQLIEGQIQADDIPALWDEAMMSLLGIDTQGDFQNGPLQDIHWPMGMFGYFPCYTLGAMYAAQWFESVRQSVPDLDLLIAQGKIEPIFNWLGEHIWQQASFWPTDDLTVQASGQALNPEFFQNHLRRRYLAA